MKKIKFASHDSFTYFKPKKWYMKMFNFMSRCQRKNIKEQYENYNVRMFDLRIAFDKNGNPFVRHGLMNYGYEGIVEILNWLNDKKEDIYIRVILERSERECGNTQETSFKYYCTWLESNFPNIKFTEGRRKYDWCQIYAFTNVSPDLEADFSSVKGSKLNDLWPWLYAKGHNKEAIKNCKKEWLMIDFVDIR